MKKLVVASLLEVFLTATAAHAEHKLLVTDVLDAKQVEAQARFEYSRVTGDVSVNVSSFDTRNGAGFYNSTTESLYSLGVGLGHGLEVTAALPYLFNERKSPSFFGGVNWLQREALGVSDPETHNEIGDFAMEAKYRLLGGEEERYAVVTGIDVKFDTAGKDKGGTGTTDVSPFIAASTNLGDHLIPYGIYRATIRNHRAADTHTLSAGVEKELNHTVTLDAKIDANFNTATEDFRAFEDFSFEFTSYIQLVHNFYVLPTAAYLVSTDRQSKVAPVTMKSTDGYRVGGSLYYLF